MHERTSRLPFQARVQDWLTACFLMDVCLDRVERNHRFFEESLELVQSLGCTRSEAHQLVNYVFDRPAGDPDQELGGVQVTLAALCFPNSLYMEAAAERELARVWTDIDAIRAKNAAKPKFSPLPEALWSTDFNQAPSGWHEYFLVRPKEKHPARGTMCHPTIVQRVDGQFYTADDELDPVYFGQNEAEDHPLRTTLEWRPFPPDWLEPSP